MTRLLIDTTLDDLLAELKPKAMSERDRVRDRLLGLQQYWLEEAANAHEHGWETRYGCAHTILSQIGGLFALLGED